MSWRPNWTGAKDAQARAVRLRLRGKWVVIRVLGSDERRGPSIVRRLGFNGVGEIRCGSDVPQAAVCLTWDDAVQLLSDDALLNWGSGRSPRVQLEQPRFIDWLRILARLPRENAEATIVALVGVLLACFSILRDESRPRASIEQTPIAQGAALVTPAVEFGRFGNGVTVVTSNNDQAGPSRGVQWSVVAEPKDELVIRVDAAVIAGSYTLRIDDFVSPPKWLPLVLNPQVRVRGSSKYRVVVYSDSGMAQLELRGLSIRRVLPSDSAIPLVWTGDPTKLDSSRVTK